MGEVCGDGEFYFILILTNVGEQGLVTDGCADTFGRIVDGAK